MASLSLVSKVQEHSVKLGDVINTCHRCQMKLSNVKLYLTLSSTQVPEQAGSSTRGRGPVLETEGERWKVRATLASRHEVQFPRETTTPSKKESKINA